MTVDGFKADNIVDGSDDGDDNDSMDGEDEDAMITCSENEDDDDDMDNDGDETAGLLEDDNIDCARTFGVPHSNIGVRMFSPTPTSRRDKKKRNV